MTHKKLKKIALSKRKVKADVSFGLTSGAIADQYLKIAAAKCSLPFCPIP